MNEQTIGKLVQRLDRLEREGRRLKRIGALVVVAIAAVVLMGQAKSSKVAKVIEAEKFVLREKNGNERGSLEVVGGVAALILLDQNEIPKAMLMADKGIASLGLTHNNKVRLLLTSEDGEPALHFYDSDKKKRLALGVRKKGSAGLQFINKDEKPLITISEWDGTARIGLIRRGAKESTLAFIESDGSERIVLNLNEEGSFLRFSDKFNRRRAMLGLSRGQPFIGFQDESGNITWGAPR